MLPSTLSRNHTSGAGVHDGARGLNRDMGRDEGRIWTLTVRRAVQLLLLLLAGLSGRWRGPPLRQRCEARVLQCHQETSWNRAELCTLPAGLHAELAGTLPHPALQALLATRPLLLQGAQQP